MKAELESGKREKVSRRSVNYEAQHQEAGELKLANIFHMNTYYLVDNKNFNVGF